MHFSYLCTARSAGMTLHTQHTHTVLKQAHAHTSTAPAPLHARSTWLERGHRPHSAACVATRHSPCARERCDGWL